MALIEIVSATMINGEPYQAGSRVEVAESDARFLIGLGMAVIAADPEPEVEPAAEPEPEPKPARSRKHSQED